MDKFKTRLMGFFKRVFSRSPHQGESGWQSGRVQTPNRASPNGTLIQSSSGNLLRASPESGYFIGINKNHHVHVFKLGWDYGEIWAECECGKQIELSFDESVKAFEQIRKGNLFWSPDENLNNK